jgi:hypothetical protein
MQEPLLIFVSKLNARIDYIFKYIFRDVVQVPFVFTESEAKYTNHIGPKLKYAHANTEAGLYMQPVALLMQTDIDVQSITVEKQNEMPVFFSTDSNVLGFDIFAASFYLVTRYEEYYNYAPDIYKRYPHTESIAFKNNFLHLPLVNVWVAQLIQAIKQHYPALQATVPAYKHLRTYDIDMAFCYKHKGIKRQGAAILAELLKGKFKAMAQRFNVLQNKVADPFDTFSLLSQLHIGCTTKPIFFFLVGKHGKFDKNISIEKPIMQQIIKNDVATYADIALHPSYLSEESENILIGEKNNLEKVIGHNITKSRQHYIKNKIPQTYITLLKNGITEEYSMGYGTTNGFRASTCTPYRWFNLQTNKVENLVIYPFCWMDTNSLYKQNLTAQEASLEYNTYKLYCQQYGGTFISIWHNSSIGEATPWQGWQSFFKNTFTP